MSGKTIKMKQKIAEFLRKNPGGNVMVLFPDRAVKGTGRTQIFVSADGVDDEGKPVRAGRYMKGRANPAVHTVPMSAEKVQRLSRLVK
jgi:hypothetical protein